MILLVPVGITVMVGVPGGGGGGGASVAAGLSDGCGTTGGLTTVGVVVVGTTVGIVFEGSVIPTEGKSGNDGNEIAGSAGVTVGAGAETGTEDKSVFNGRDGTNGLVGNPNEIEGKSVGRGSIGESVALGGGLVDSTLESGAEVAGVPTGNGATSVGGIGTLDTGSNVGREGRTGVKGMGMIPVLAAVLGAFVFSDAASSFSLVVPSGS
jgi:hypothetical protein